MEKRFAAGGRTKRAVFGKMDGDIFVSICDKYITPRVCCQEKNERNERNKSLLIQGRRVKHNSVSCVSRKENVLSWGPMFRVVVLTAAEQFARGSRRIKAEQKRPSLPDGSDGLGRFLLVRFAMPGRLKRRGCLASAAFGQSHFAIRALFETIGQARKRSLDLLDRLPGLLLYKMAELLGCPAL